MKIKNSFRGGFTLIELLVVIAIIGILAGVVTASLASAGNKGKDTSVKSELKQLYSEAQNYLDSRPTLGALVSNCTTPSTFFTSAKVTEILTNITNNASLTPNLSCATDSLGINWAVSVSLRSDGSSFCADSSQGNFTSGKTAATSGVNQGTCQ